MPGINDIIMEELDKERYIEGLRDNNQRHREIKATLAFYGLTLKDYVDFLGITRQGFYHRLNTKPEDTIYQFRDDIKDILNSKE
jgi:hypothetical protein